MKTMLVDGNNAAWRLQLRLPELSTHGEPVQVIYGFLRLLRSAIVQFNPDKVLVCWDNGRSAYRRKLFPEYKANRDHNSTEERIHAQQSVNVQIEALKITLELLNVATVSYPDMEADDLIGIAARCLPGEKIIITSDQDALHLVNENVSVWSPIKTRLFTHENFRKITGLSPEQFLHIRALSGDTSDNISSVARGFGPQTATQLISQYGSIEALYSKSIAKKVERMGNRYALLYNEGAREIAYRNLLLMDLRFPSQPETPRIEKLIHSRMKSRHKIDKLSVRKHFMDKSFVSLLKDFSTWLLPFTELDT